MSWDPSSSIQGAAGERHVSRKEFLSLGASAGVVAAGAPLFVSSCGKDLPEVQEGQAIAGEGDLEPNSALVFADAGSGEPRVLVRLRSGEFTLFSAECTHRGCNVSYEPAERELVCPCHRSSYSPESGAPFGGPAKEPLQKFDVRISDGSVFSA